MRVNVINGSHGTQLALLIMSMFGLLIFFNMFAMTAKISVATGAINYIAPKCPKCGDRIEDGEKFCNNCGCKLQKDIPVILCTKCGQLLNDN